MNYGPLLYKKLEEFHKELPDYSFGDILTSALRLIDNREVKDKFSLMEITDEEFYSALSRAQLREKNYDIKTENKNKK